MDLVQILAAARRLQASDVHLAAGYPPLARIHGEIEAIPGLPSLDAEQSKALIYGVLSESQRSRLEAELGLDAAFSAPEIGRVRINAFFALGSLEAALRLVPANVPAPEAVGLGPTALGIADLPRGLILVTGPTGSGKSTTLACLIDRINATRQKHIVTIEDPVEYVHRPRKSLVRQREVGQDARSFAEALRHALREDPDVILVGEMRDLETTALALTAAETGHLCLSTLHTQDAAQTVSRIIDVFPSHQQNQIRCQLAGSLKAVFSQTLVRRQDGRGLVAARGLMTVTPGIANLIRENKTHMIPSAIETGGASGMFSVDRALGELVRRGIVPLEEALSRAVDPQRVLDAAGRARAAVPA